MRPAATARRPSWAASIRAVVTRPDLWPTAVRVLGRLAPTGWWRRAPFLPVPTRDYWAFRAVTAFGDERGAPDPAEVIAYLEWCRAWPGAVAR